MSTSLLYDSSFAKYDDYDIVLEIYVPKGSRGSYITELSAYDNAEQEVLLNPNDLYITNVQKGIIDKHGKRKNVLQALALSKDRECYKEIEQSKEKNIEQSSMTEQDMEGKQSTEFSNSLPVKQNRFSKIFSHIRAIFARQKIQNNRKNQGQKRYPTQTAQSKEKNIRKSDWKLGTKEKTRIQKENSKIAKKYQEQANKQEGKNQQENTFVAICL